MKYIRSYPNITKLPRQEESWTKAILTGVVAVLLITVVFLLAVII